MAFNKPQIIVSPTGASLAMRFQPAQTTMPPKAVVQICHGLAEHAARYQQFALFLSSQGFHCYAHDHRGHGHTSAKDAPLGRFAAHNGAATVLQDVGFIHQHIRKQHPDMPVILFGHSMGGLITLAALQNRICQPDAAAICNANFSNPLSRNVATLLLKIERMLLGSDVPSSLLPKLTFQHWARQIKPQHSQFDWLSHDPAAVARYQDDPLCGFAPSVSLWLDVFELMKLGSNRLRKPIFKPAAKPVLAADFPLFLQGGGQDPATDNGQAVTLLSRQLQQAGFNTITTMLYPQMRHESLHETDRASFMQDFIRWANIALA